MGWDLNDSGSGSDTKSGSGILGFLGMGAGSDGGGAAGAVNGGADPVSAVANAIGAVFGTFTQISSQTQAESDREASLLLASQPKRPQADRSDFWLFIGMFILLLLIILAKIFLR